MTDTISFLSETHKKFLAPLFERKTNSVTAIDVRQLTSYTDTIVIIEVNSNRQVTSLAEHMIRALKKLKIPSMGIEGVREGQWALLDYGDIIFHVFNSETKAFYDLEGFWADAPRIDLSCFETKP